VTASEPGSVVALAGGVGAARFLNGLTAAIAPERITAIVNTGDDRAFYGVHVSPDLDIVTYTLAGLIDRERGFGLAGDRFELVERLAELGHETWFRLGDRDYAHCLHRTLRLAEGASLGEVTEELRRTLGVASRLLPMSDAPCPTIVELGSGQRMHFEEYLVRDGAPSDVAGVDLTAAEAAAPAAGVLEAIRGAELIAVCPSNPVVSIGPVLCVAGVRDAIAAAGVPVVAVSPIVGGAPIKGPADSLLRGIGVEVSALGVAAHYRDWIDGIVIDERDAALAAPIRDLGLGVTVTDTIMTDRERAAALARELLALAEQLR